MFKLGDIFQCGKYEHFKQGMYLCIGYALDIETNEEFIFYKQLYGNNNFWVRPRKSFFQCVEMNGEKKPRFSLIEKLDINIELRSIALLLKECMHKIKNTETEEEYEVIRISTINFKIIICNKKMNNSYYLTDYEIAYRMGKKLLAIDNELVLLELKGIEKLSSDKTLVVGDENCSNHVNILKHINPCSIDLRISDIFIKTRRRTLDPQAPAYLSNPKKLWKTIKPKYDKRTQSKIIKLKPNQSIITCVHEKIKLPIDCAGKIEIKSTYARLSLSVTTGDFCNPGYVGHFPLLIHNYGNHTILLRAYDTMLQLMLLKTNGTIVKEYEKSISTFYNENGVDDGMPYSFWRERAIKRLHKENKLEEIFRTRDVVLSHLDAENLVDMKERFNDTFLEYAFKKQHKYNHLPSLEKAIGIYNAYEKNEKIKAKLQKKLVLPSGLLTIVVSACVSLGIAYANPNLNKAIVLLIGGGVFFSFIIIYLLTFFSFLRGKTFYTLSKFDFEKEIRNLEKVNDL